MNNSIKNKADWLIQKALKKAEGLSRTVQSLIHPEISFRYNSINLLVARRGVGKTIRVMKELVKLSQIPGKAGYTTLLYVSDKTNDTTVNELIKFIKLKVRYVTYEDITSVLDDIIDAKSALEDAIRKSIVSELTKDTILDLETTLDCQIENITTLEQIPHTFVFLDDAINILKDTKFKKLQNLLFQNRQPRLTIFICVQDVFGVPIKIKRNCDSIWIFAGLTDRNAFGMMARHLGIDNVQETWENYKELDYRDALIINYNSNGIELELDSN
jgi:hypothetical protein